MSGFSRETAGSACARLSLANNRIGARGAVAIAKALGRGCALIVLDLAGNAGVGDEGCVALANALATGAIKRTGLQLETLRLDACKVTDASARSPYFRVSLSLSLEICVLI